MTNHATLSVHEQLNKCASDKGSQHTFTMEIIIDVKKNKYTFGIKLTNLRTNYVYIKMLLSSW